jgi:beta-lactamase class A
VGSAFKLGVLKALKDEIAAGRHKWDEVATLTEGDKSLPTGQLQDWPAGSPVTLNTLATLMISISDNTAADVLQRVVGADAVEAALGIAPVLTTRQLFVLKADAALRARYVAADLAGKRQILGEADAMPLPDVSAAGTPHSDGLEWYLSATKLCELIGAVGDLELTQINPGAAQHSDWAKVSFKGGSEVGVLSAASLLTAKDGTVYCVAGVWNGPVALDQSTVIGAYGAVLHKLAGG